MEITINQSSTMQEGDLYRVDKIWDNRLDMANLRYSKTARIERFLPNNSVNLQIKHTFEKMMHYREMNTLNFQLEKMDDYLFQMKLLIDQL